MTPINELLAHYESEGCDHNDMDWVCETAFRYVDTMPDGQVCCLLYTLAKKAEKDVVLRDRLKKKISQRDQKITGLKKRIADLETAVATQAVTLKSLPKDVERAVQRALCNVRMIPVLGIGSSDKIVEVRAAEKPSEIKPPHERTTIL